MQCVAHNFLFTCMHENTSLHVHYEIYTFHKLCNLNGMQTIDLKTALPGEEDVPFLKWEEMAPAPVDRLDGYSAQIDNLLYVFAGYQTIDQVQNPSPTRQEKRKNTLCIVSCIYVR